jgi:hypothetical protein
MPRGSWPHGAAASHTRRRPPSERPVSDQRGRLLTAALGFAGLPRPSYDRALWALRTWLDSWAGVGRIAVGMARQATTFNSRGTTSAAGARPSTRPGWSTRRRARRAPGGRQRRGTRRSGRRGRGSRRPKNDNAFLLPAAYLICIWCLWREPLVVTPDGSPRLYLASLAGS